MKKNNLWLKTGVTIGYVVMVYVNYLATSLPLGGKTTGELSDLYPNLFTPAGVTFSIWGLIYLLLGIYVVYQFWIKDEKLNAVLEKINFWFMINVLANMAWIFAWHYQIVWLSLVLMIVLLITLIKIADIMNVKDYAKMIGWWVCLPFSIYFGWITVATIVNVTVQLVDLNWDGFGLAPEIWTIVVLLVGAVIGVLRTLKDKRIPYILVLVWAYAGILLKHVSESGFAGQYSGVITTLIICEVVFLVVIIGVMTKSNFLLRHNR